MLSIQSRNQSEASPDRRLGRLAKRSDQAAASSVQQKSNCACGGSCPKCESGKISTPNDKYEKQADQVAEQVTSSGSAKLMSTTVGRHQSNNTHPNLAGNGQNLSAQTRAFFEPRLGSNFDQVRVHDNPEAAASAQSIQARAFTQGNHIVFNQGEYNPQSGTGKKLLAHELTHVVQQQQHTDTGIQRKIQFRPPGRGEATAFDRAQELVDRLNNLSLGVTYFLATDGRTLSYRILLPTEIDNFDQQMMDFMDLPQVIPMRLITSAGTLNGNPIVIDTFLHGYVDLDDLMASDDTSFQSNMVHILAERAVTNRYEQRIGSPSLNANTPAGLRAFNRSHRAGINAEADFLRNKFHDPSIVFNRERRRNSAGDFEIIFRSQTHGYRVIQRLNRAAPTAPGARARRVTGGNMRVVYQAQTYTVDEFLSTGPLATTLSPLRLPLNRGNFGLGVPRLQLGPSLGIRSPPTFGSAPPFGGITLPQLNAPLGPRLTPLLGASLSSTPDLSLIDWLSIRGELNLRGAPINDAMLGSITSLWMTNYRFLNRTVGFSPDRAAFWTNKTIPMAVGSSINRDYPTMVEQIDREMNTSSLIFPASDVMFFLIGGGGTF